MNNIVDRFYNNFCVYLSQLSLYTKPPLLIDEKVCDGRWSVHMQQLFCDKFFVCSLRFNTTITFNNTLYSNKIYISFFLSILRQIWPVIWFILFDFQTKLQVMILFEYFQFWVWLSNRTKHFVTPLAETLQHLNIVFS